MVLLIAIIVGVAVFCFLHGYIAAAIVCLFGFSKRYGWPALLITSIFLFWHRHWFVALLPPLLIMWNIWGLRYLARRPEQGDSDAHKSIRKKRLWIGAVLLIMSILSLCGVPVVDYIGWGEAGVGLAIFLTLGMCVAGLIFLGLASPQSGLSRAIPTEGTSQTAARLRKMAERGDADAQVALGFLYRNGLGVSEDYAQAALWYRKAAEKGVAVAQSNLGAAYRFGQGVPQDYAQAMFWSRKAAEQGDAMAQAGLGILYGAGLGVSQDIAEAYFWFALATAGKLDASDSTEVAKYRDDAASILTPADLSREQERARKWFEEHRTKPQ